jgi:hypothetical protein
MEGKTAKFALLMIGKTAFLTFKSEKAAQNREQLCRQRQDRHWAR